MKTRFDLLYDVAARLGNADVINAELVLEQLRAAGAVTFDDHAGYGLAEDADLLAAYRSALAARIAELHDRMAGFVDDGELQSRYQEFMRGRPAGAEVREFMRRQR